MSLFTLVDAAVQAAPQRQAILWIHENGERHILTAGELHRQALACGAAMTKAGIGAEDLVLLAAKYDIRLLPMFLGAAYGYAIPSIVAYLSDRAGPSAYADRVSRLALSSGARAVFCSSEVLPLLSRALEGSDCRAIGLEAFVSAATTAECPPAVHPDAIATVQFTSGTTGAQKGVCLSHRALEVYLDVQASILNPGAADTVVSWLPLYHDMGLITGVLFPLASGFRTVLMSPAYWVRSPAVMLRLIDELRGTFAWLPTFALSLMARNVRAADAVDLDLSSWRFCAVGAEIVRGDAIDAFCERFQPHGLRREIVRAGYGMAENVLTATLSATTPRIDCVETLALQRKRAAVACGAGAGATSVVSNGKPLSDVDVVIVADDGERLAERQVGEILIRSPHLFSGYHRRPDLSEAALRDGWFHSGDVGYLADGELYICGRKKDVIIVGGNNVYPEDIEAIADRTEGVQPGRAVAFGVVDEELATERIVLVCELRDGLPEGSRRQIDRELRRRVLQELDVTLAVVHFAERGWVLKTTSGKHARHSNREKYLAEINPEAVG